MQSQSLLTKVKHWGTIKQNLKVGNYSIIVNNSYGVNHMRMIKGVRICESSIIGSKNYSVPALFLIFAIGCLIYAIVFYKKFRLLDSILEE